jgi:hypothetical protein
MRFVNDVGIFPIIAERWPSMDSSSYTGRRPTKRNSSTLWSSISFWVGSSNDGIVQALVYCPSWTVTSVLIGEP